MSCRGIIIAGRTNRSRTQMAEGVIRHMTGGLVYVTSGGTLASGTIHPMAVKVMAEIGVCIKNQSVSTLATLAPHAKTYDVFVGISNPQTGVPIAEGEVDPAGDLSLMQSMPRHWTVVEDASDTMQKFRIWSPRDPMVMCEISQRKFQDHLYEGEPQFPVMMSNQLRLSALVRHESWAIPDVSGRKPLETEADHLERFRQARDAVVARAELLVGTLEKHYGEQLLVRRVLQSTACPSAS